MGIFTRRPRAKDAQGTEINRRKAERVDPSQIPSLKSARLVAGPDVHLINLSSGGALLESSTRIVPGAGICIRLVATDALFFLRGRVLQARALALRGSELVYECRIAFDEEFSLLAPGQAEPTAIAASANASKAGTPPAGNNHWPAVMEEGPDSTLTVTVPVPRLERDLREVFS